MRYGKGMMGWDIAPPNRELDRKRERKGVYYLVLSLISLIGGMSSVVYGLTGQSWVQKPYVAFGAFMVLVGFSIVIGGFGKVKQ